MKSNGSISYRFLSLAMLAALFAGQALAAPPSCPKANLAPDTQNVLEGVTVQLNGNPSTPNGISYLWTQTSGPSITFSNPAIVNPTFVAPNVGSGGDTVVIQLKVTGGTGCVSTATSTASTTINIADSAPVNDPPVAAATVAPAPAYEGDTVTLDGSTSSDPDLDVLSFSWVQDASDPTQVTLTNANTAIATFTAPNTAYPGGDSLHFKLTVSDGLLTDTFDVISNIVWVDDPPTASLSCPASVDEGATLDMDGSASSDPDDGIQTYVWEQVLGPPNIDLSSYSGDSVSVTAPSLSLGELGEVRFKLTVTDFAGQDSSDQCTLLINDVTPPVINGAVDKSAEATSASGAAVSFSVTAYDNVDGAVTATCLPTSGSTFALGETTVDCSASDTAGNTGYASFKITVVDTTPPTISAHADVNAIASSAAGAVVSYTLPTATDLVDGSVPVTCLPVSGSQFPIGPTTVNCSATDSHLNTGTSSFVVNVSYDFNGFFRPVDNLPIVNIVKAGQGIPVKFSLGGDMGLAIMAAGYPASVPMTCQAAASDALEETVTAGGSSLSYDSTAGQYIYVWKSEKSWAGSCRQLRVKLADGSMHTANFSFTR